MGYTGLYWVILCKIWNSRAVFLQFKSVLFCLYFFGAAGDIHHVRRSVPRRPARLERTQRQTGRLSGLRRQRNQPARGTSLHFMSSASIRILVHNFFLNSFWITELDFHSWSVGRFPCRSVFWRVLLGYTGFYRVYTGFYWILLGFIGFYRVFTRFYCFFFLGFKELNRV